MILGGKTILIVEDEMLIAIDLASTVERRGGRVIGPFATVAEAMERLDAAPIDGAICDAMLADRDFAPLALELIARGVPFVIHSATGAPDALRAVHADLPIVSKPAGADRVITVLAALL